MNEPISVSQLNGYIKELMDHDDILQQVLVRGETSNYKVYPSGHHYFTLKDGESVLKCVMFKSQAAHLQFRPSDGVRVIAAGRVSVFPRDGQYQLYCSSLLPDGAGDLTAAFEQLKAKLSAEGLFDPEHKKALPRFPKRVVLITSPAGAVVRDMIRIFRRRWPMCELIIAPVRVQGEEAPTEIASALRYVNKNNLGDVVVVGRGGGSLEDLWAFNDERVARAVFASHIPVVSAVGHEPDVTISDFVADVRASTPSHAAELISPEQTQWAGRIADMDAQLRLSVGRVLEKNREKLSAYTRVLQNPGKLLETKQQSLDYLTVRLGDTFEKNLSRGRERISVLAGKLDAMSPLKVLSRGYAIASREDGSPVRNAGDVRTGETLIVRPHSGRLVCVVKRVEELKRGV